jgi:hypothetical protein
MLYSGCVGAVLEILEISPWFNFIVFLNHSIRPQVELKVIILTLLLFIVDVVGCGEHKVGRNDHSATLSRLFIPVEESKRAYWAVKQRFEVAGFDCEQILIADYLLISKVLHINLLLYLFCDSSNLYKVKALILFFIDKCWSTNHGFNKIKINKNCLVLSLYKPDSKDGLLRMGIKGFKSYFFAWRSITNDQPSEFLIFSYFFNIILHGIFVEMYFD